MVVACRERDYDYSLRDQAPAYVLQGLEENEIRDYLKRYLGAAGEEVFDGQIRWDPKMRTLAGNPLMLWLISNVVLDEPKARLPVNRGKLFRKFVDLMPRLRASEKIAPHIPVYVVTSTLARLSFEMQKRGLLTVDLATIAGWRVSTQSWHLEDVLAQAKEWRFLKSDGKLGEPIEFLHQLFLEYFAAAYLEECLRKRKNYAQVLGERPFSFRWNEITVMLAGITDRPVRLVKWLGTQVLEKQQWHAAFLVERCRETTEASDDAECLSTMIAIFAEALKAEEEDTRKAAAEALGRLRDPRAGEPLVSALKDQSVYVSRSATQALAEIGPSVYQQLVAVLSDQDARVRRRAVEVLAKVGGDIAVEHLTAALTDEDPFVRSEASEGLTRTSDTRAVEPLISALQDIDISVRLNAADALGRIGDSRAIPPLIAALYEEEIELNRRAEGALAKIGAPAVDALVAILEDDNVAVRRHAMSALGKIKDARSIEPLIKAMRDDLHAAARHSARLAFQLSSRLPQLYWMEKAAFA